MWKYFKSSNHLTILRGFPRMFAFLFWLNIFRRSQVEKVLKALIFISQWTDWMRDSIHFFYTPYIMWCLISWCCHVMKEPLSRKSLNTSGNRHLSINRSITYTIQFITQPHHRPVWCHKVSHATTSLHVSPKQTDFLSFISIFIIMRLLKKLQVLQVWGSTSGPPLAPYRPQVFLVIWLFTCASTK